MVSRVCVLFLIHFVFNLASGQRVFRNDYTYIDESDSFYKLHPLPRTLDKAKIACEREGATLFYPDSESEVLALIEYWKRVQPFIHSVIVNINKSDIITREGIIVPGVYANWDANEPNEAGGKEECVVLNFQTTLNDVNCNRKYPFICKRESSTIQWNGVCNMSYPDYKFSKDLGRCYKVHSTFKNWTDAYAICYGEQSQLAVVRNEMEAAHMISLIRNSKPQSLETATAELIHMGFFNRDGWITIKGVPLHLSGYNKWATLQPDGRVDEDCGAMSSDGLFHDIPCNQKLYFICEHEVSQ